MKKLKFFTIMGVFTLLLGTSLHGQYQYVRTASGDTILKATEDKVLFTVEENPSLFPGTPAEQLTAIRNPRTMVNIGEITEHYEYSRLGIWVTTKHYRHTIVSPDGKTLHPKRALSSVDPIRPAWGIMILYFFMFFLFAFLGNEAKKDVRSYKPSNFFIPVGFIFAVQIAISFGIKIAILFILAFFMLSAIFIALPSDNRWKKNYKIWWRFGYFDTQVKMFWGLILYASFIFILALLLIVAPQRINWEFEYSSSYFMGMIMGIPIFSFCVGYFFTRTPEAKAAKLLEKEARRLGREVYE